MGGCMAFTRKEFLKLGLVGGAGLALSSSASSAWGRANGTTGNLLRSKAQLPKPFMIPLYVSPVLEPVRTNEGIDYYEVTQRDRQDGDFARPGDGGLGLQRGLPRPHHRVSKRTEDRGAPGQRSSRAGLHAPARWQDAAP